MADGPTVLGYYTLSSHSIERHSLPEEVIKKLKLPKYELIPTTLMGRLAVDLKYQGQRIGEIDVRTAKPFDFQITRQAVEQFKAILGVGGQ